MDVGTNVTTQHLVKFWKMKIQLVLLALACTSAAPDEQVQEWVVSPDPIVQLNVTDERNAPFGQSTHVTVLSDGRIAIIDQGRIEFHSPTGLNLARVDIPPRADSLPEIPQHLLVLPGDSVVALTDGETAVLVDPSARFVRRDPFLVKRMLPEGIGHIGEMLVDRSHVVVWGIEFDSFPSDSLVRPAIRVIVANLSADSAHTVGRWGGIEQLRKGNGAVIPRPLSPTTYITVSHERIYIADSATPIVEVFDVHGVHVRSIRLPLEPRVATANMIQQERSGWLDWRDSASRAIAERDLELVGVPELAPFHTGVLVDAAGALWIRSTAGTSTTYTVVDSVGRPLARLSAPVTPLVVGNDFILGREVQPGRASLRLHRLRKE